MDHYRAIERCRICGNTNLAPVLDLGNQALTGIFPKTREQDVGLMPLELLKCMDEAKSGCCGLLQLRHTGNLSEFYGHNYGYRSGLNRSMVEHLQAKVRDLLQFVALRKDDLVIDIGSNDSTLLQSYSTEGVQLVGIDPTGVKFREYYPSHIQLIPEFFSAQAVRSAFGSKKARIITSISMFYDLEEPLNFVHQIRDVLADDGVWSFEQSYMPTMLEMNSYDTVCHEHLEYYGLKQIMWMAEKAGLEILDVELNAINGGSFSVRAALKGSPYPKNDERLNALLRREQALQLDTLHPYQQFEHRIQKHRDELLQFLSEAKKGGKKVFGYGASTKGNVLLQYCGITQNELPYVAEVNPDKFGSYAPGTLIPIISETEATAMNPEYYLVLPWHFRENILSRVTGYLRSGGTFVFPLPRLDLVRG